MIIIDDADHKPPHRVQVSFLTRDQHAAAHSESHGHSGSALLHPQQPQTGSTARSSYTTSYHTTQLLPPPPPPPYPSDIRQHRFPARNAPSPSKRFWKAFALALLVYLALLALARIIVRMATHGIWDDDESVGVPSAEDGNILHSIHSHNWTSYHARPRWAPTFPSSAESSFTLPITADAFSLLTRGSYQTGNVEVKQAVTDDVARGDRVRVDVRVAYHDQRALARATLCRLRKSGNRHGIGIYTPVSPWSNARDQLYFEVVFTFPAAARGRSPLRIREFTTHANNFAHEVGDLWQSLLFENVHLNTANAAIRATSITLTRGSLTSSNGAIHGHFNTSDALILRTSNARIQATASLFNSGGNPTQLDMRTSNGAITSSVSLVTETSGTTNSSSCTHFTVTARTSNAPLELRYDDAPATMTGSHLVSDARTSNGPAHVAMHPTYEGTYAVSTSNARAVVREARREDPLGRGRRRVWREERRTAGGTVLSGRVYWDGGDGHRESAQGASTVHTSNAPASMDL